MDSGQVHLDERIRGVYAYYFVLDPESPTAPVPNRQRRYVVGCSVESYVEAFFGLVRHLNRSALAAAREYHGGDHHGGGGSSSSQLPPPPSANVSTIGDISAVPRRGQDDNMVDNITAPGMATQAAPTTLEILRPWSHLYSSAFGPLAFETFVRRVHASESTFLFCELNEEQARIRAAALANPAGASWGQTSTRAVSPPRPTGGNNNMTPLPGNVSPYRNGNRLKGGMGNAMMEGDPTPRPGGAGAGGGVAMSGIAGHASERLSSYMNQTTSPATGGGYSSSSAYPPPSGPSVTLHASARNVAASGMALSNAASIGGGGGGGGSTTEADLARLQSDLAGTANSLVLERSRAVVQNLSDAERSALVYKYDTTRKELEEERKRSSNLRETLRVTMADFEERLEKLQQESANALSEAAARERHNMDTLDRDLSTKFKTERDQLELNLLEKDRKLAKTLARVEFLEGQCDALQKKSDLLATEEQRAAALCVKSKAEQERLEDECNRLRRSLAAVEARLDEETRLRRNTEVAYRSLESHSNQAKADNDRLRKDCERFSQYSLQLHDQLRRLDNSANEAAQLAHLQPSQHQQQRGGGGGMPMLQRRMSGQGW